MSATLADIRAGLKSNLDSVSGLRCYDAWPDVVVTPMAVVVADPVTFMEQGAFQGAWDYYFEVRVYVTTNGGVSRAQHSLDGYCEAAGDTSVIAAVERAGVVTVGVSSASVLRLEGYNEYTAQNANYLRVTFKVKVMGG